MHYLETKRALSQAIRELKNLGINSAELDARLLLEKALDKDNLFILVHPLNPLTNSEYARFRRYIRRRKTGEPIAYILGHKEFYGYDFVVNKNVLIPRPETEWLVEKAIGFVNSKFEIRNSKEIINPKKQAQNDSCFEFRASNLSIIDIGTGSGNIIISLAKELENSPAQELLSFYATDISTKALNIAKKNATIQEVKDKIKFFRSDLFFNPRLPRKFDLIIANLPYVPERIVPKKEKGLDSISPTHDSISFEPKAAIFAADNGAAIIKKFMEQSKTKINRDGLILIELDPRNAKEIERHTQRCFSSATIELRQDLAGLDRYLTIRQQSA